MKKKLLGFALAFASAFAVLAAPLSEIAPPASIPASAADSKIHTPEGFWIETINGVVTLTSYDGQGGSLRIPDRIMYIPPETFKGNTNITILIISKNSKLAAIENGTFEACTNLKEVHIGNNMKYIGEKAFAYCEKLEKVSIDNDLSDGKGTGGIRNNAFAWSCSLHDFEFTNKSTVVDTIGTEAFLGCLQLRRVVLPDNLAKIESDAFLNCPKLTKLTVPEKTEIRGDYVFGYMYGWESFHYGESYYLDRKFEYGSSYKIANGVNEVNYFEYYLKDDKIYSCDTELKPIPIELSVSKGSPAEKWAKDRKIKYKSSAVKLPAPTGLKVTGKTKDTVSLKWNKVEGADYYRIFMYNPKTKTYERCKDVKGTSTVIRNLVKGTEYKFRVAAIEEDVQKFYEGERSEPVSAKTKKK